MTKEKDEPALKTNFSGGYVDESSSSSKTISFSNQIVVHVSFPSHGYILFKQKSLKKLVHFFTK